MTTEISCTIVSTGAWGTGFADIDELSRLFGGELTRENTGNGPKPEIIPPNERRRAPLTVRLAVEASWQATQKADISPKDLKCVFVSGLGDTELTDYMCKVLASETKQLSPTKFHNSVHNAPAGYWTISTGAMGAANSVAGFDYSFGMTLLDAMIQCQTENTPILVVFYDAPVASVLKPMLKNDQPFSASLIIIPLSWGKTGPRLQAMVSTGSSSWPSLCTTNTYLRSLFGENPAARALCLLEHALAKEPVDAKLQLPLSQGTSLTLTIATDR